jgi:V8-like Glu-specific endopeptidase
MIVHMTRKLHVTALAMVAVLAGAGSVEASPPGVAGGPVAVGANASSTQQAWTPARMRRAEANAAESRQQRRKRRRRPHWTSLNSGAKPVTTDLPGTRTIGRLFSKRPDGSDWVCSATLVDSTNRSVVWTAGHCLHSGRGGAPHTNFAFVPGYRPAAAGGPAPFGIWPATYWGASQSWTIEGDATNFRRDFGGVVLAKDGLGRTLTDVLGVAQHIAFSRKAPTRAAVFGYPALPPFDGESLFQCGPNRLGRSGRVGGTGPDPVGISCSQTAGTSGGPWLTERDRATNVGTMVSVTSVKASGLPRLYGPVLNSVARRVHAVLSAIPN